MQIELDFEYPTGIDQVRQMLCDPAFREQSLAAQKVVRGTAAVTQEGATTVLAISQTQATDGVPSFVRKFTGEEITITTTERWTGTSAAVEATIPGAPGSVSGSNELVADGQTTVLRVRREIRVNVPLIGSKLAQFVAGMQTKALEKEHEAGLAWLATR